MKLVIEVLAKAAQAKAEFASLDRSTATVGDKLGKLRAPAAAAFAGVAVGAFKAVGMASDLNETVSKSQQIFGTQAGAMEAWSNTAAKSFGLSKEEALGAATSFGDMFSQIGFGGKQAAAMSKSVVGLSADLGSFNNLPTADVNERIAAAFRGEYDSLQALIPNINAARVESEAMAATGKKTAKELTAQEKASAVLAIVQKDGAKAAGDFARTQDGAANKTKIAQAQVKDLAANLGQKLLPAYAGALGVASQFLDFLGQNQGAVTGVVAGIAALAAILLVASAATTIYNGAMAVARIASVAYTAVQWLLNAALTANPIGIIVVAIGLLIAGLVLAWRNSETFRSVVTGAFNAVAKVAQVVWGLIKTGAQIAWSFITAYVRAQIMVITTVWNKLKAVAAAVWGAIKTVIFAVVGAIIAPVVAFISRVVKGWNLIKAGAVIAWNAIKSAISAAVAAIKGRFDSIKSAAASIFARIKSIFSPGALVNAGRQLIAGLASGIRDKIGDAVAAVRAGVQKIKDLLPGSPIKDGPLKGWNNGGAGKRLMGLLVSGIRAEAGSVQRELSSVLAGIADPNITPNVSLGTAGDLSGLSMSGSGGDVYRIDLTVQAGVGDPVAIGKEVIRVMDAALAAGARRRAS